MSRKKVNIPKEIFEHLYIDEYKSPATIAKLYKCTRMTVQAGMRELGIPFRSQSLAGMKYRKFDFSGNLIKKVYLIGFRLGDLNIYQTNSKSDLIVARCNTTSLAQMKLIDKLFSKYGTMTISEGNYSSSINCYLSTSFSFLLTNKKKVPEWIERDIQTVIAFIAGYLDAGGTFQINQGRGRFV